MGRVDGRLGHAVALARLLLRQQEDALVLLDYASGHDVLAVLPDGFERFPST